MEQAFSADRRRSSTAVVVAIAVTSLGLAFAARAAQPEAVVLMQEHKCYICHGDREARTGPAFVQIAARYRGKPDAIGLVSARLTRGAHGDLWNMPPHPEVTRAEARLMARYIMSRK